MLVKIQSFAREQLFSPLGIEPGSWQADWEGNYLGFSDVHLTADDLAKFGWMHIKDGRYNGEQSSCNTRSGSGDSL